MARLARLRLTVFSMGLFKRRTDRSSEVFWRSVNLEPGEEQVDYAHLRWVMDDGAPDKAITTFLTDRRLLVLSPSGKRGSFSLGSSFIGAEPNVDGIDRPNLRLWLPTPGRSGVASPMPLAAQRQRSAASRVLARDFLAEVYRRLTAANPGWSSEIKPGWEQSDE